MKSVLWNGFRWGVFLWVLVFAGGCWNQNGEVSGKGDLLRSATADLGHLPKHIIDGSAETFLRKDNITALLLAGGVSVVMDNSGADDNLARNFDNHRVFHGFWNESLNVMGCPATHFSATGLWYAISEGNGDELGRERAWTMMTALSVAGLTTGRSKGGEAQQDAEWQLLGLAKRPHFEFVYGCFGAG